MTRLTYLQEGIIRVVVYGSQISIEKCETYDNFEHEPDWSMPIDDIDEAEGLVSLLQEGIRLAKEAATREEEGN